MVYPAAFEQHSVIRENVRAYCNVGMRAATNEAKAKAKSTTKRKKWKKTHTTFMRIWMKSACEFPPLAEKLERGDEQMYEN